MIARRDRLRGRADGRAVFQHLVAGPHRAARDLVAKAKGVRHGDGPALHHDRFPRRKPVAQDIDAVAGRKQHQAWVGVRIWQSSSPWFGPVTGGR
jgi:hypothetical protein